MVIRVWGAVLGRVGGVGAFSTVRGASGPIRYNPQSPGTAKPSLREIREDAGVSHSRPLQRWKRAPKTDEEWGLRKNLEKKRYCDRQDEAEEEQSFASAELQRLKAEMKLRDSSSQSSAQNSQTSSTFSHRHERIHPAAEEERASSAEISPSRSKHDSLGPSSPSNSPTLLSPPEEAVPATVVSEKIPGVKKNQMSGDGLFYGDGRKFEAPQILKERNSTQDSGLFYGDGRKFEGLLPNATDLFDDSFIGAEGKLFKTADTEEDKAIVKEKQAAKNYALRLLGISPQTAHKLRQKLIGRNVSSSVIEATIVDLQRCGLQSDLEYAEAFARSRWRSAIWGPQRLKQELRQRGVCKDDIDTALERVFTTTDSLLHDDENVEDNEGRWGMTKEANDHLLEKARIQWGRGGSISAEARKRRMVGWLQRRGFNWSITSQILKSLESSQDG